MAKTKHIIDLDDEQRNILNTIINENKESERTVLRARILLLSDVSNAEKLSIPKIAEKLGTTHTTVQTARTEYARLGFEDALYRKKRKTDIVNRRINDEVTVQILQVSKETPPAGHKKWSLRLLCKVCMERGIVEHIGPTSMGKIINDGSTSIIEKKADRI